MLNMMELFPFGTNESFNLHTTDYIHASVEIKKLGIYMHYIEYTFLNICNIWVYYLM